MFFVIGFYLDGLSVIADLIRNDAEERRSLHVSDSFIEPVAFLDVKVNPIANDVGHINNKKKKKNASKIRNFSEMQGCEGLFCFHGPKKPHFPVSSLRSLSTLNHMSHNLSIINSSDASVASLLHTTHPQLNN